MNRRVALVTGGGRGIGREAALLLSAAGARVMVVARSATELAAVGLEYVAADLGTAAGCALAVAETERRLGPIDVLVVNHGIGSAHERLVWEQDPEVWRETMRINLDGPFELARLTLGSMRERGAINPQDRVLGPREVAQVIAFLCSDAAGGVNGEAITVALGGIW